MNVSIKLTMALFVWLVVIFFALPTLTDVPNRILAICLAVINVGFVAVYIKYFGKKVVSTILNSLLLTISLIINVLLFVK